MPKATFLYTILAVCLLTGCQTDTEKSKTVKASVVPDNFLKKANVKYDSFGFRVDTLQVNNYEIERNESLYLMLDKLDFSPQEIYSVITKAEGLINFNAFKPGQPYRVYRSKGPENKIRQLVWQPNPVDFVVLDLQDSLSIYKASKDIKVRNELASAEIKSSLYEAIDDEGLSTMLAYKMAEIFAWEIDFFGLRKGDRFEVLYEKKYIDDQFYGVGDVLGVEFEFRNETFSAFKFNNENIGGYFDEEGKSVQKALLKAPFKFNQRISSGFSHNRFHPVLHRSMPHYGVDYAAPYGTPVLAVGDGRVTEAQYRGANGNIVKIRHNEMYDTAYLHLKGFAKGVRSGSYVKQGQIIGFVGNTGRVTGTHLDYRIYKHGRPVNPLKVDLPSAESISDGDMEAFKKVRDRYRQSLDEIKDKNSIKLSHK